MNKKVSFISIMFLLLLALLPVFFWLGLMYGYSMASNDLKFDKEKCLDNGFFWGQVEAMEGNIKITKTIEGSDIVYRDTIGPHYYFTSLDQSKKPEQKKSASGYTVEE